VSTVGKSTPSPLIFLTESWNWETDGTYIGLEEGEAHGPHYGHHHLKVRYMLVPLSGRHVLSNDLINELEVKWKVIIMQILEHNVTSRTRPPPPSSSRHCGTIAKRSASPRFVNVVLRLPLNRYETFPVSMEIESSLYALIRPRRWLCFQHRRFDSGIGGS
jgi:hypothetical protein